MKATVVMVVLGKLIGFGVLYLCFQRTLVDRRYPHHVAVPDGSTRAEELNRAQTDFFYRLAPADGQYYREIALEGYEFKEGRASPFFPLFPAAVALTRAVYGNELICAAAFNLICGTAGLLLLARFIQDDLGRRALHPMLLYLAFPAAGFFQLFLTESLFLLLSVATIYAARSGRFWWAATMGFLAGLTRPQGVLLVLPLLVEAWEAGRITNEVPIGRKRWRRFALALAPAIGMAAFVIYTAGHTGSVFSVFQAQETWNRKFGVQALGTLLSPGRARFPSDVLAAAYGVVLIPFLFHSLPRSVAVFGAAMALFPLATGSFLSYFRFMAPSFPHVLCLSFALEKRPGVWLGVTIAFSWLQVLVDRELMSWTFFG